MEIRKEHTCFNGSVQFCQHRSATTGTPMNFSVFVPHGGTARKKTLLWLSGLTCTEENFMAKSGAQKKAAALDMILICPDTSPRGLDLPGEHVSYDFGSGAGFYLDATEEPWSKNYRMYSYLIEEFLPFAAKTFPIDDGLLGISGHSMGGMGALILGLRNPQVFKSLSAFSPIVNPSECPWGQKAFGQYLGLDRKRWDEFDPCVLLEKHGYPHPILIDQGDQDEFLEEQLLSSHLEKVAAKKHVKLELRFQNGFDHSYYFVSSFIDHHLDFHQHQLENCKK